MLASNTTGTSHWNLHPVIHETARIVKWFLEFWKICAHFLYSSWKLLWLSKGRTLTLPVGVLRSCKTFCFNSKTTVRHHTESEVSAVASVWVAPSGINWRITKL